jgi:putative Holliday junction resolvase
MNPVMALLADPFELPAGRLVALDLGRARHGAAVCDEFGMFASPLTTLSKAATRARDFAAIAELCAREHASGILVGLPAGTGEELGEQARWTRRYAGRLAGAVELPVAFWDETLTSADATRLLAESGGRSGVDAVAAALLLQDFLEARRHRAASLAEVT